MVILDIFSTSASFTKFQIIEKTLTSSTAVYQEAHSLKSIITCCIPGNYSSPLGITAVKLEILSDDVSKLIIIRALSGEAAIAKQIIDDFKNKLNQHIQCPQDNHYFFAKSFQSESGSYQNLSPIKPRIKETKSSVSDLHKILSSVEYEQKYQLAQFIEEIKGNLSISIFETIDSQIETIIKDMKLYYVEIANNSTYFKSMLEKKIYTAIYDNLLIFYKDKAQLIDEKFSEQQLRIKDLGVKEVLTYLQVNDRFKLTECQDPYAEAKTVLGRFNRVKTPIEKINCLISTIACMKSCVVDYWKGNLEIQAMDDELPILMFLLLTSRIEHPEAEFQILTHYVTGKLENENRIILNFSSAVSYLALYFQY